MAPADGGGVAFWAHVGGFAAGLILVRPFERAEHVKSRKARGQRRGPPPPWPGPGRRVN